MKQKVLVTVILAREVEVEAESEREAEKIVREMYDNDEIQLTIDRSEIEAGIFI